MRTIRRPSGFAREARRSLWVARLALQRAADEHCAALLLIQEPRRAWKRASFRARAWLHDHSGGDSYLESTHLFQVPVSQLQRRAQLPYGYDPARRPGAVVGGDWDLVDGTIMDSAYWVQYREALTGRRDWHDSLVYSRLVAPALSEPVAWRRRVLLDNAEHQIRRYRRLYASMCVSGCLPQCELGRERGCAYRPVNTDDISVAVGRTGELFVCQGGHRVETARALGIETVPVWIGVRHPEWWRFRRTVVALAAERGGLLPERLCHPDLATIPFEFDPCAAQLLVRRVIGEDPGLIVDAAPGWGSLLHLLEDEGRSCAAVATDAADRRILERLREAGGRRFAVVAAADEVQGDERGVAAVLLLRDTEQRLSDPAAREELEALLARLRPRHLLLGGVARPLGVAGDGTGAVLGPALRFAADAAGLSIIERVEGEGGLEVLHLSQGRPAVAQAGFRMGRRAGSGAER